MLRPVIDVRPASPADLDELVDLWMRAREESAQLNHVVHAIPPVALRERLAALLAGDGETQVLVGRRDGHCAGFVVLRESVVSSVLDTRVLMIEHLYVHPQHRRVGLAKAMLGATSAIAERSRLEQILCNLLPAPRETHRFFARLGFAPVSVRRVVSTGQLRRRLAGDHRRRRIVAIEELAFRRRTLRERYRDKDRGRGDGSDSARDNARDNARDDEGTGVDRIGRTPSELVPSELVPAELVPAEPAQAELVAVEVVPADVVQPHFVPAEPASGALDPAQLVAAEPGELTPREASGGSHR